MGPSMGSCPKSDSSYNLRNTNDLWSTHIGPLILGLPSFRYKSITYTSIIQRNNGNQLIVPVGYAKITFQTLVLCERLYISSYFYPVCYFYPACYFYPVCYFYLVCYFYPFSFIFHIILL